MKRLVPACLFLFLCLTACTPSNYVRLKYQSEHDIEQFAPNAPKVTIVQLADERSTKRKTASEIGQRSDNSPFLSVSSVSEWITKALEQELSRRGVVTRFTRTPSEATGDTNILTGSVQEVWLKQRTGTEYGTKIVIKLKLNDNPATTYESNIIRQAIPFSDITEVTMTEALRTLLDNAVPKVVQQLKETQ